MQQPPLYSHPQLSVPPRPRHAARAARPPPGHPSKFAADPANTAAHPVLHRRQQYMHARIALELNWVQGSNKQVPSSTKLSGVSSTRNGDAQRPLLLLLLLLLSDETRAAQGLAGAAATRASGQNLNSCSLWFAVM